MIQSTRDKKFTFNKYTLLSMSDLKIHKVRALQKRKKSGLVVASRWIFLEQNSKLINVKCPKLFHTVLYSSYLIFLPSYILLHATSLPSYSTQYYILYSSTVVPISVRLVLDPSNVSHPQSSISDTILSIRDRQFNNFTSYTVIRDLYIAFSNFHLVS